MIGFVTDVEFCDRGISMKFCKWAIHSPFLILMGLDF